MIEREIQGFVNRPATASHGLHTAELPNSGAWNCERVAALVGLPMAYRLSAASLFPLTALNVEGPGSLVVTAEGGVRTTAPAELPRLAAPPVPGSLLAGEERDGLLQSAVVPADNAVVLHCTWADGGPVTDEIIGLVLRRIVVLNLIVAEVRILQGRALLEDQAAAQVAVSQGHGYFYGPEGPSLRA